MPISAEVANAIVDGKTYADVPRLDAVFGELRRAAPFAVAEVDGYDPFWVASKHADVQDIELRADLFLNEPRSVMLINREMVAANISMAGGANTGRSMVEVDGKEHKSLRSVAFSSFLPGAVRKQEEVIRSIARDFVTKMLERGPTCDFVQEVAYVYPLRVVMTLLGIPPEDELFMLRIAHELHGATDADTNRSGADISGADAWEGVLQAIQEFNQYYEKVTHKLRGHPADCVNSLIANAKIDGEYLSEAQLMGYYLITATAGHDTTAHTVATGMWVLAERPELFARLKADAGAMPAFVEETVRWATPVKHFMRTVAADTEVRGKPVKKDDWIMLAYHSANRDEDVFADPYEFRLERPRNPHIAFGYGPHVCLGQHLARLEMRILWEELLLRLKEVSLDGVPKIVQSNFVCGPKSVPIRYAAG